MNNMIVFRNKEEFDEHNKQRAERLLEEHRKHFEEGDRFRLMAAIAVCATYSIPMPAWVANSYLDGFESVRFAEKRSWNDAFGEPLKGRNLDAIKEKQKTAWLIWKEANEYMHQYPHAGKISAIEEAAEKYGIGKTLAIEYFYECEAARK